MIRKSPHPQLVDLTLADLSAAASIPPGTEGAEVDGWERIETTNLGSGYKAALFKQKDSDEHVLAFALAGDWPEQEPGLVQASAAASDPYQNAIDLARNGRDRHGEKLILTGYSAAGDMATFASAAAGSPAVVFNPLGIHDAGLRRFGITPSEFQQQAQAGQVRIYAVEGNLSEQINTFLAPLGMSTSLYGTKIELPDRGRSALQADSLASVKQGMEESGTGQTIGALSAQYESGKRGTDAVGWDSTGGTSYGKYQISSSTMPQFLTFIEHRSPEMHQTLIDLKINGGKNGEFANAWRNFASTRGEELSRLEHAFIQSSHMDIAFDNLQSGALKARIESSKTLQDVLWSTAVQHGPGNINSRRGAVNVFETVFRREMSNEDLIRDVYANRGARFPSSTPAVRQAVQDRFNRESVQALREYRAEIAVTFKDNPEQAVKIFPELTPAHDALNAIKDANINPRRVKEKAVEMMHNELVKRIDQDLPIPSPQQALKMVLKMLANAIHRGQEL